MAGIDAGAMYQAGFSSKSTGRNVEQERRERKSEMWRSVASTAYNALGGMAINQINQSHRNLQIFRDQSDSQTSALNLQIDKMPKGATALRESVMELRKNYDKSARCAAMGFGKKKRGCKQDMAKWMTQLTDMNAFLEIYKTGSESAQDMISVVSGAAGEDNQGGKVTISSGANEYERNNTSEQANGLMGMNLRWDINTGQMMVQRNGEWSKDENDNDIYQGKLDVSEEAYDKYANELSGEGVDDANILSPEEWAANQQRGEIGLAKYSDLKFAYEKDDKFRNQILETKEEFLNAAYKKDSMDWETYSKGKRQQFKIAVNAYNDAQFKEFYFGGFGYDHSTNTMSEDAPAYQKLKKEDLAEDMGENVIFDENGVYRDGYGPGSKDWKGKLLALKGQSFVAGTDFRTSTVDKLFEQMEEDYKNTQKEYNKKHPDPLPPSEAAKDIQIRTGVRYPKATIDAKINKLEEIVENKKGTWLDFDGNSWEYNNGKLRALTGYTEDEPPKPIYKEYDPQALLERSIPTASHLYNISWAGQVDDDGPEVFFNNKGEQITESEATELQFPTYTPTGDGKKETPYAEVPEDNSKKVTGGYYLNVPNTDGTRHQWNGKRMIPKPLKK